MIHFKKLRYMNLLSTGNQFTELELNLNPSTLIVGSNGSGKSSLIDALTFALFGRAFRDINKNQLINSITEKKLLVEVEFDEGPNKYLIRRGIKPNVFEVYRNDELLNVNASSRDYQSEFELNHLKMNFKTFSQIVVLGSTNYVPFMQLKPVERRKIVEDLLDIQIFSVMNNLLKERVSQNKKDIVDIEHKIELTEQKIDLHNKHMESIKRNNQDQIDLKNSKIDEHNNELKELKKQYKELNAEITKLEESITDREDVSEKRDKYLQMESTLEDRLRILKKEVAFFHDNDDCPTCKQSIQDEFKQETLDTKTSKIEEIKEAMVKISVKIDGVRERLTEISAVENDISKINMKISDVNSRGRFLNQTIASLNEEITVLQESTNQPSEDITESNDLLKTLKKSLTNLEKEKKIFNSSSMLLKDSGIKTKIINQYIPVMNQIINKYLSDMNFMCEFTLDGEFNETIKSRYRDEFSYASFSEGEKMRIDLAIMFTWRAVAKMRNSASSNLLIMDEVFDGSADSDANFALLDIIESLDNSNIFIISHNDKMKDVFENVIEFKKVQNFSRMM